MLKSLLVIPLLGLAACGSVHASGSVSVGSSVSGDKVASEVRKSLSGTTSSDDVKVTCGSLRAKVGATGECDVTVDGARTGLHLVVDKADKGDVHWTQKPFIHGDDVVAVFAKQAGVSPDALTCPDIDGVVGKMVTCDVKKGSATAVDVTVTSVQGLHVGLNYKAR